MLSDSWIKKDLSPTQEQIGREEEMKRAFLEEAGLEDVSAEKLRKSMLSADEAIIAKQEQLEEVRIRKSRKADWDEYVDAKRRWGRALHHSDLIRQLSILIPNLYVTDGFMKHKDGSVDLSLYIWDRTAEFEPDPRKAKIVGGTVYLGYLHQNWNPEYEIDFVNDVGVAIRKLRGWRTTLLSLICRRDAKTFLPKSLITEDQAYETFGYPTNGETASNFRRGLWKFRNTSPEQARLEYQLMQAAQKYRYA